MKEEIKFAADSMLGRLARWLRILGFDTLYIRRLDEDRIQKLKREQRIFLSRKRKNLDMFSRSLYIHSDHINEQLREVISHFSLPIRESLLFSRCIICNTPIEKADKVDALENVPEYVYHRVAESISFCPTCKRFYWPGTHRDRVLNQLSKWSIIKINS